MCMMCVAYVCLASFSKLFLDTMVLGVFLFSEILELGLNFSQQLKSFRVCTHTQLCALKFYSDKRMVIYAIECSMLIFFSNALLLKIIL